MLHKNPKAKIILQMIAKEPNKLTATDIAKKLGITRDNVKNVALNANVYSKLVKHKDKYPPKEKPVQLPKIAEIKDKKLTVKAVAEVVKAEGEVLKAKTKGSLVERKYKVLLGEHNSLQKEYESILGYKESTSLKPVNIKPSLKKGMNEAVPLIVLSDWHAEEEVKPGTVGGKNKFTLDVCKTRVEKVFQNALKMLREKEGEVAISDVAVFLLGDFITGRIHEENLETSQLLPIEALLFAQSLIEGGIEFLLDNTDKNFSFYCKPGNHSRITHKVHASTELGNSLELALYSNLRQKYEAKYPGRVRFHIEPSYISTVDILGHKVRFHHGHAVSYGGGIGGLHIPLRKAIHGWNANDPVELDIMGHYHNFRENSTLKYIVNGSLIGYNAYAERIKAALEPPVQGFALMHKNHGVTSLTPLYAE